MKRTLLITAIVLLCLFLLPCTAEAAAVTASGSCGAGVTWALDDTGTLTISGAGQINTYTAGSAPWYAHRSRIKTIFVEDGITAIPESTFHGCSKLESLRIPFVGQSKKTETDTYQYPLGYIFGKSYYSGGVSVTQGYYGQSTYFASTSSYYLPQNLYTVTVSGGILSYGAFDGISSLKYVNLGANVTSVNSQSLTGCANLTFIQVDEKNPILKNDASGVLFAGTELVRAPIESFSGVYTIPEGTTTIGSHAFRDCRNLVGVNIPEGITSIANSAFRNAGLQTVTIPNSCTYLGVFAFYDCKSLTSVSIGTGMAKIDQDPFDNCINLKAVYITDLAAWCKISFWGASANPLHEAGNLYLNGELVENLVIPQDITNVSNNAFSYCTSLQSVVFPEGLETLGRQVFSGCANLKAVVIPEGITQIDLQTFSSCASLTAVSLPSSLTQIRYEAFRGCSNLAHVAYAGTENQWNSISLERDNTCLTDAPCHYQTRLQVATDCTGFAILCPTCAETIVSFGGTGSHSYDEGTLIKPATFANDGQVKHTCTTCGKTIIQTIPRLVGKVCQWNMVLADTLKVNFCLDISSHMIQQANILVQIQEESLIYPTAQLTKTDDGLYYLTVPIAAAQMHDPIRIAVVYNGIVSPTMTYSVRQYADTLLADATFSRYHPLIREMLNYGIATQRHFDYNTQNLTDIPGTAQYAVPAKAPEEMIVSGSLPGVAYYGASLVHRDKIAVRFYFQSSENLGGFIFQADKPCTIGISGDMIYVEIGDILPQHLDQMITLKVNDAEGSLMTVSYSPMNYIVRMYQSGSDTTTALVKALYNYHLAAKAIAE